jgi:hypothetical protein
MNVCAALITRYRVMTNEFCPETNFATNWALRPKAILLQTQKLPPVSLLDPAPAPLGRQFPGLTTPRATAAPRAARQRAGGGGAAWCRGQQLRASSGGQFQHTLVVLTAELSTHVPNGPKTKRRLKPHRLARVLFGAAARARGGGGASEGRGRVWVGLSLGGRVGERCAWWVGAVFLGHWHGGCRGFTAPMRVPRQYTGIRIGVGLIACWLC